MIKKMISLPLILLLVLALGCKNKGNESIEKSGNKTTVENEFLLNLEYPEIVPGLSSIEIKNSVEKIIVIIDQSQSELQKKESSITLNNVSNTPLTIWYYNRIPLKIEHGVADDSGNIDDEFIYYLKNGKLWYSDQIFARYLFQDDNLMYWMDEHWNINDIPLKSFSNREIQLKETVKLLIDKSK